jgi:hypothetical protein
VPGNGSASCVGSRAQHKDPGERDKAGDHNPESGREQVDEVTHPTSGSAGSGSATGSSPTTSTPRPSNPSGAGAAIAPHPEQGRQLADRDEQADAKGSR